MGCVIQFSLFDTQTWFLFFFEAIEGCLVFKYLASVGEKTRTTIKKKKNMLLDNDFLSPVVKQREKRAKKGGWCKERCYEADDCPEVEPCLY